MIIGIHGKIGSGKDTVGKIIQYLTSSYGREVPGYLADFSKLYVDWDTVKSNEFKSSWEIKKFADTLKDVTCLVLGCTRQQLEDHSFKETPLGLEWKCWQYTLEPHNYRGTLFKTKQEALDWLETEELWDIEKLEEVDLTPRKFMQLFATEGGRELIHPDIWVNSLFSKYDPEKEWIITDLRFLNEYEAIKSRGGVTLKIIRDSNISSNHISETELDSLTDWNYIINNNGSIEQLIEKVKSILTKEKII